MIGQNTFQIRQIMQKIVTKVAMIRPISASVFYFMLHKKQSKNHFNFLFRNPVNLNQNSVKKWIGIDKIQQRSDASTVH